MEDIVTLTHRNVCRDGFTVVDTVDAGAYAFSFSSPPPPLRDTMQNTTWFWNAPHPRRASESETQC